MADQKIELEIALRDTVSQTLEAIASRLETMNKKMTRGGESISDSADTIKKLADNTKQTGLDAKDSTKSLLTMNDVLKQMSMLMVSGPVGAVVGIAVAAGMAAEGVTNFVKKRLELRNLATETGLSENQISVMQRAQDKMGIPLATATGNIKQIAGSLTELRIKKTGSELYQGLADIGQGKFADDLLKMVESGKIDEAARALIAKHAELRAIDIDTARKYATHAVKLPESMLIGYEEAARGLEPAYRVNLDHAVEWVKEMEIIHARARSVVDTAMHNAFGRMAWFVEHMDYSFLTGKPNPKYWGPSAPPAMPPLPSASGLGSATPKELDDLKYSKKESLKKQKDIGIILQDMWDKTKSTVGRQEGGPVTSGNMYRVGERGPEVFAAGGQYAMVGEGGPEVIRAPTSGNITKADLTRGAQVARERIESTARDWQPPSPSSVIANRALGFFAPKGLSNAVEWLKTEGAKGAGSEWRPWLRQKLGIEDPKEPTPWEAGGSWGEARPILSSALSGELRNPTTRLDASVTFNNVPPGVRTSAEADGMDSFKMARSQPLVN